MHKAAFDDRFAANAAKIRQYCRQRIGHRFKDWSIIIPGCYPMFIYKWFGYLDGVTKEHETLNLNFNNNKTKFNTKKDDSNYETPSWFLSHVLNNGVTYTWNVDGDQYRATFVHVRSVGLEGKCEFSGKFKKRDGDEWFVV